MQILGNIPSAQPRRARWLVFAALSSLLFCAPLAGSAVTANDGGAFAQAIERAHGSAIFRAEVAVSYDFELEFGGKPVLSGRVLTRTDLSRVRIDLAGGPVMIWDGTDAWVSPAAAPVPQARFHLLTWPYFLAAPHKLRDPGARLAVEGERPLLGASVPTARLTFAPGTGDTPDDWYVVYRDPATDRLRALAYIVTYGKTLEAANKEPHSLVYDGFIDLEGVAIPTDWALYGWDAERGPVGDPVGRVRLKNVRFASPSAADFALPLDRRKDELPAVAGDGKAP